MAEPVQSILLLAGRLGVHDDGWSVRPFLDRLERLGLVPQLLCVEAAGDAADDFRVVECAGLGRSWRLPLAVRGLRFGEALNRPDLVHVLNTGVEAAGLALAENWGLPYVQTVDEFPPDGARLRVSRRWCRRLVAGSRELADDLETRLGVPPAWVSVINPGIEAPVDDDGGGGDGRGVPVIGTAGPLVTSSGFATFLNAARKVLDAGVDAEFVVAGRGEDEVDLRRRADRLRIAERVTFANVQVVGLRFWSVLDVFCQPSHVPSVGRTLATALAFGVPSVAADIEGLRALVADGVSGLRVPPGDSAALAGAILDLLSDRDRARRLGRAGRDRIVRDFHPDDEARSLKRVYKAALAGAPGRALAV